MFIMFTIGVAMWLAYGVLLNARPMIVANTITLILAGYILYMKVSEKSRAF